LLRIPVPAARDCRQNWRDDYELGGDAEQDPGANRIASTG